MSSFQSPEWLQLHFTLEMKTVIFVQIINIDMADWNFHHCLDEFLISLECHLFRSLCFLINPFLWRVILRECYKCLCHNCNLVVSFKNIKLHNTSFHYFAFMHVWFYCSYQMASTDINFEHRSACLQTTVCTRLRATFCYCRYKAVERLAAEEFERERPRAPTRGRTEITLCLSPNPASRSLTRCTTPSSIVSQEDTIACTAHETSGKRCPPIIYSSWVSER